VRKTDLVTLARDDELDLAIAPADVENGGSLDADEGDDALRRDLEELVFTPMYTRLYGPFWGHRFVMQVHAPEGLNVLKELRYEWRRLMEREGRVDANTAEVTTGDNEYIFSVRSKLTGELISVRRS
jgi:hypothetical protein